MVFEDSFSCWIFSIKRNKKSILFSLIFLLIAVFVNWCAGTYVSRHNWSAVPDLILNNVGPYNLGFIFTWLFALVIVIFIVYPLIYKPDELSYVLNMLGFFIIIRSVFMLFTNLGSPIDAIKVSEPGVLSLLTFSNDLFFSGHTGLPFLGFLVFRNHKFIKYFMLVSSVILAITVLLMHVHYSIDVFSAFFITYGVYRIGKWMFKKERDFLNEIN